MSRCRSYRRGHTVHWIQARKSLEGGNPVPVRIVRFEAPYAVILDVGGTNRTYFSDRIDDIAAAAKGRGRQVAIDERWSILRIGQRVFSVASGETWQSCDQAVAEPTPITGGK